MNILIAPLSAILIGLFVRSRLVASVLLLAIEGIFFSFQTLVVLLAWMSGQGGFGGATEQGAFGPAPTGFPIAFDENEVWLYGLVNLGIISVALVLTNVIVTLMKRRRTRRNVVTTA